MLVKNVIEMMDIIRNNYNRDIIKIWYDLMIKFDDDCPCYVGGYIYCEYNEPSVPLLDKCPLNQFNGSIQDCLDCRFSQLYRKTIKYYHNHTRIQRLFVFLYLQQELGKLIDDHKKPKYLRALWKATEKFKFGFYLLKIKNKKIKINN